MKTIEEIIREAIEDPFGHLFSKEVVERLIKAVKVYGAECALRAVQEKAIEAIIQNLAGQKLSMLIRTDTLEECALIAEANECSDSDGAEGEPCCGKEFIIAKEIRARKDP